MLSTLPVLIIDSGHFGGKFKDVCQKNISFTEFPHALNLNKTVQVYFFMFAQLSMCLVHGKMYRMRNLKRLM
jgi:hypothetical protein